MRIKHCTNYQSIPREIVFDSSLSLQARFLYVYMISKPDGWDYYQNVMCRELGVTKNTLIKYERELIASGWLKQIDRGRNDNGTFSGYDYEIYDVNPLNGGQNLTMDTIVNNCPRSDFEPYIKDNIYREKREENKEVTYDFENDSDFYPLVMKWLDYKKSRKEKYKNAMSVNTFYKRLKELSNNNSDTASKIIEQSIANNYSGIFPLKINSSYGTTGFINSSRESYEQTRQRESEQRIQDAADVIMQIANTNYEVDF